MCDHIVDSDLWSNTIMQAKYLKIETSLFQATTTKMNKKTKCPVNHTERDITV